MTCADLHGLHSARIHTAQMESITHSVHPETGEGGLRHTEVVPTDIVDQFLLQDTGKTRAVASRTYHISTTANAPEVTRFPQGTLDGGSAESGD